MSTFHQLTCYTYIYTVAVNPHRLFGFPQTRVQPEALRVTPFCATENLTVAVLAICGIFALSYFNNLLDSLGTTSKLEL